MPQAVFIIGWGRSGTTWLCNLLQQHPKIAAVTEQDKGVFESVYFSEICGRYGDLQDSSNFFELSAVLARSFYFRQAGVDPDNLLSRFPADYPELFIDIMDDFANAQDSVVWIEKTPAHTLMAVEIARVVPNALFISIERDVLAVIRSRLGILESRKRRGMMKAGRLKMAFKVAEWVLTRQHYVNRAERVRQKLPKRVLAVRYEDLQSDAESVMKTVCGFLGLEFDPAMLESPFRPNSSFTLMSGVQKEELPQWLLGGWLKFWQALASSMPKFLLAGLHRAGVILTYGPGRQPLPYFFFNSPDGMPKHVKPTRW